MGSLATALSSWRACSPRSELRGPHAWPGRLAPPHACALSPRVRPARRLLAANPLHATNLLALLHSPADKFGSNGYELVRQKVDKLVWMGGSYWVKDRVEWNWGACGGYADPNATKCGESTSDGGDLTGRSREETRPRGF